MGVSWCFFSGPSGLRRLRLHPDLSRKKGRTEGRTEGSVTASLACGRVLDERAVAAARDIDALQCEHALDTAQYILLRLQGWVVHAQQRESGARQHESTL